MEPLEPQDLFTGPPATGPDRAEEGRVVSQARQGDPGAWEALLAAYRQPVFRLAYLLVGDAAEAEDIAQETFIRAYYALERFDASRPLRPWLLKIAVNLARNRMRSIGRYLTALKKAFLLETQASLPHIEQIGERNLESRRLWQLVQRLSPPDQQVIYLRYFLDLSVEETAEALGVAHGTVKSRLHRALERLRPIIIQDAPEMEDHSYGNG